MNNKPKTIESQNQRQYEDYLEKGAVQFGPWTSASFRKDPKRLGFQFARYKFCAKMLSGKAKVLEIGCGDAPGIPIVLQEVNSILGIDIEPVVIEDNIRRFAREDFRTLTFAVHDIIQAPLKMTFDAAYSLDVIEHIPPKVEESFLRNMCLSLTKEGVCIIGTPNINSEPYASSGSVQGHVNLKSADSLKESMSHFFHNVFMFSMNDEMVHTGFYPMAHYLIGMGVGVKEEQQFMRDAERRT